MTALDFIDAPTPNTDARRAPPDMILLHYTGMQTGPEALDRLRDPDARVSAHYVVEEDGRVFRLAPEERRCWHAGVSWWKGETDINAVSIGIEIVNPGHEWGYRAFPEVQIQTVMALVAGIRSRWTISADRILGHSDVAPRRKTDPGELFPWKRLAEAGHGLWFEPAVERIAALGPPLGPGDEGLGVHVLQAGLHRFGYEPPASGVYDDDTRIVVEAFQRHWRPEKVNGVADGETRARLMGLLQLAQVESLTGVLP
ncbi:N-acetylmuramoyl-L-alanine amidase [Brevundimonas sp.]|uniref:N-acetylmuramoyl-L-alanine amidase n=1 Tax=Brevundimonas sp. TaxID=1871086 RepID=UPI001DD7452B|nr:N-acetylmuramoyl-L-alanine amidase [Brevundimonas sp.]MBA4000753.1 N-acetylmuramoyl-L-alanine amidase [Brevundimonas sp.]